MPPEQRRALTGDHSEPRPCFGTRGLGGKSLFFCIENYWLTPSISWQVKAEQWITARGWTSLYIMGTHRLSANACTDTPIISLVAMLETLWLIKWSFHNFMELRGNGPYALFEERERICDNKLIWVGDSNICYEHFHFSSSKRGILHHPPAPFPGRDSWRLELASSSWKINVVSVFDRLIWSQVYFLTQIMDYSEGQRAHTHAAFP